MLEIKNLNASINNKEILKGFNISIKPGELHAIYGSKRVPGKSTLANVLSNMEKKEYKNNIENFRRAKVSRKEPQ